MSSHNYIDPNESACGAEEFASNLLMDGADWARALLHNLPGANAQALSRHPIVAVGYALLVHLDHRANEQYLQGQALIEELGAIRESIALLGAERTSDDPSDKPQPASKEVLSDYAWLKELLEFARPTFSDAQNEEAIIRLRRLAGV